MPRTTLAGSCESLTAPLPNQPLFRAVPARIANTLLRSCEPTVSTQSTRAQSVARLPIRSESEVHRRPPCTLAFLATPHHQLAFLGIWSGLPCLGALSRSPSRSDGRVPTDWR